MGLSSPALGVMTLGLGQSEDVTSWPASFPECCGLTHRKMWGLCPSPRGQGPPGHSAGQAALPPPGTTWVTATGPTPVAGLQFQAVPTQAPKDTCQQVLTGGLCVELDCQVQVAPAEPHSVLEAGTRGGRGQRGRPLPDMGPLGPP